MTLQSFMQTQKVKDVSKKTGIPEQTLYDLRKGRYQNIKLKTLRQLLEMMLEKGYTENELLNMIMKEEK